MPAGWHRPSVRRFVVKLVMDLDELGMTSRTLDWTLPFFFNLICRGHWTMWVVHLNTVNGRVQLLVFAGGLGGNMWQIFIVGKALNYQNHFILHQMIVVFFSRPVRMRWDRTSRRLRIDPMWSMFIVNVLMCNDAGCEE